MEIINIPNNTSNLSGDNQIEVNRKTAANFTWIKDILDALLAGSEVGAKVLETNLMAGVESTISGALFTPPITAEPVSITAFQNTEDGMLRADIIRGYVANGDYYDVLIAELTEEMLNIKINAL